MILEYTVLNNEEGQKVGQILRNKLHISARLLNKLKMNEKILVNDVPVFSSYIVRSNDHITVKIDFKEDDNILPEEIELQILYEDEYLLAVNKPAGIVVHPSSYHPNNTLANGVKFYLNNNKKIRPINRLDRDTSGIVLFAKNEYIQELMIQEKSFKKEYLTIITGFMENKEGIINLPIGRKDGSIMEREVREDGQTAITKYNVMSESKDDNVSLLHIELLTGRTHQIRVHFAYFKKYILGDSLYGNKTKIINRQSLHAWRLSFIHPIKKDIIKIEAPLFDDMKNVIKQCNLNKTI